MRNARAIVTSIVLITGGCTIDSTPQENPGSNLSERCTADSQCPFGEYCDFEQGCVRRPGDVCLSQCELGAGYPCEDRPLDEFEDFDTLRDQWLNESYIGDRLAGSCADGTRFLAQAFGVVETRFFDGPTGQFISLRTISDFSDSYCCGVGYWPLLHDCELPIVEEVISGSDPTVQSLLPPYYTNGPCIDPATPCTLSLGECATCSTKEDCDDGDDCTYDSCAGGTCWAAPMACPDPE